MSNFISGLVVGGCVLMCGCEPIPPVYIVTESGHTYLKRQNAWGTYLEHDPQCAKCCIFKVNNHQYDIALGGELTHRADCPGCQNKEVPNE